MAYSKHAFNCCKCPKTGGEGGCPMWWETLHTNIASGEEKWIKACGYEQLPIYLIELIKASNRPAAAIESTRNEIALGLSRISQAINAVPRLTNGGG